MEDRNLRRSKQNTMAASSSSSSSKMDQSFPTWRFDKPCTSMQWSELIDVEIALVSSDDNAGTLDDYACDLMILGVSSSGIGSGEEEEKEKRPVLEDAAANYDSALQGALSEILEENSFKAKLGDTTPVLRGFEANKPKRYVSLGLGDTESASEVDKNKSGFSIGKAVAAICIAEKKVKYARVCLPKNFKWSETILKNFSTMFYQEMHIDNRYRTGDNLKKVDLKQLNLVIGDIPTEQQREAIRQGRMLAKGVVLTKDIINAPHCILNSESLADTARRVAETSPNLSCQILGLEECEERGMGAFLGVARGSETQPQFIHLTYKPTDSQVKTKVGIVGKGVCFDTGGYNIKMQMMELMKFDCGGAAAVIGAALAVGQLAPPGVEAHFIVAACENMISHKAYVPSDILTASNGKTIEVDNTDAEGRLTLADALVFADKELECDKIIELSTLTGAIMVALGREIFGFFTNDEKLAEEIQDVSIVTAEKSWRMPLAAEYKDKLESKIADLKNCGNRFGSSINGALFVQQFVDEKKPFAHLDIAGPVWNEKLGVATGFGPKLIAEWIKRQGS